MTWNSNSIKIYMLYNILGSSMHDEELYNQWLILQIEPVSKNTVASCPFLEQSTPFYYNFVKYDMCQEKGILKIKTSG